MVRESGNAPSKPVLVVDDDETIVEFISMALADEGIECEGAENGEEAMRKVADLNPSLILLDMSMPKMSATEFCKWLRVAGHEDIPVILMTAGLHAARRCDELAAQGYLTKPFDLHELRAGVKKILGLHSQP